jgi:hypothetical protein
MIVSEILVEFIGQSEPWFLETKTCFLVENFTPANNTQKDFYGKICHTSSCHGRSKKTQEYQAT